MYYSDLGATGTNEVEQNQMRKLNKHRGNLAI
jgi:hypothetical protein